MVLKLKDGYYLREQLSEDLGNPAACSDVRWPNGTIACEHFAATGVVLIHSQCQSRPIRAADNATVDGWKRMAHGAFRLVGWTSPWEEA